MASQDALSLNWHKKEGLEVVERHIMPEEMAKARECFLTGTAAEVTPVSQIGISSFAPLVM